MQSPGAPNPRSRSAVIFSLLAHASVFVLLLIVANMRGHLRAIQPTAQERYIGIEVAGGSHATRLSLPPSLTSVESRKAAKEPQPAKKLPDPARPPKPQKSEGGTSAAVHQNSQGSGDAASGSGNDAQDADPAFPVFSPKPPVNDRKLLPDSQREIVVDVNLNAAGDVIGVNLVKGMGSILDQIVLDTVKTWRFHPATVNGNPVASQAELIFPFNPSYPITPS